MTFVEIEECASVIIVSLYDTSGIKSGEHIIELDNYEEGTVTTLRNTDMYKA